MQSSITHENRYQSSLASVANTVICDACPALFDTQPRSGVCVAPQLSKVTERRLDESSAGQDLGILARNALPGMSRSGL